jgi:signal transduction histidine kinase
VFLVLPLLMILLGMLFQSDILVPHYEAMHARKVQRIVRHREEILLRVLDGLQNDMKHPLQLHSPGYALRETASSLKKEGLSFFVLQNDSLVYWSDSEVPLVRLPPSARNKSFSVKLDNGWYVGFERDLEGYQLVGLMLIRHLYAFENKYLTNDFEDGLGLPPTVKFSPAILEGSYPVYGKNAEFLFSLVFDQIKPYAYQVVIPSVCFFIGFLLILYFFGAVTRLLTTRTERNQFIALVILFLFGLKLLMQYLHIPQAIYDLELFQPQIFASSDLFPSLGDLFLWSILTLFAAIAFHSNYHFPSDLKSRHHFYVLAVLAQLGGIGFFMGIRSIIGQLVLNSTLFTPQSPILLASQAGLVCMLILLMLLLSFALLADKIIAFCQQQMTWRQFAIWFGCTLAGYALIAGLRGNIPNFLLMAGLLVMAIYIAFIRKPEPPHYSYSSQVYLLIIFSLLTVALITHYSGIRLDREMELRASNLSSLHDPVAEHLLINMDERIRTDSILCDLAIEATMDVNKQNEVIDYLRQNYFFGYINDRYNIQAPVCRPLDDLEVRPENRMVNCVDFFTEMYQNNGVQLPRKDIWFIDNLTGQSSYLSWYLMDSKVYGMSAYLFIKLDAFIAPQAIGYPALLMDERTYYSSELKAYSYAKYHKGRLMVQNGDFKYNLTSDVFENNTQKNARIRYNKYIHLVFRPTDSDIIVLSTPVPRFISLAILFAYFFVSYFLLLTLAVLIKRRPRIRFLLAWNFKNKIQYSMMIILLLSFIGVGIGTVIYVIDQYQKKQSEMLLEKMQSIYLELLSSGPSLNPANPQSERQLSDELVRLSNSFLVDINLFSPSGKLMVSSRPEIYLRGLIGRNLNPVAYTELSRNLNVSLIQEEQIGEMSYLSAYRTIVNDNNDPIAYLNLPHFTQQEQLLDEITNVVVTVVNVALIILLITFSISVVISNTITLPLRIIQEKFRSIRLEGGNEKIQYNSVDEIGGLVHEYNRMIGELAQNAQKLASSERELAWREMAKQVAHEINNSLTPMKVHIQYLQRAWEGQSDKFERYMSKTPGILLEQIDTLSSIAREFSNFAKMPVANMVRVDIITCIHNTVILFASDNVSFKLNFHGHSQVYVYADREQMLRVFVNLFRNAIQARSEERPPEIRVDLLCRADKVYIRVRDNGVGIPEEMHDKIFRPNFTTKSSGSGIGLAIVMSVVHSVGGTIKLYPKVRLGASFVMILPIMTEQEFQLPDEATYEASLLQGNDRTTPL